MTILVAPFAKKMRGEVRPSPKDYPWPKELVAILESSGNRVIQVGVEGEQQIASQFKRNLAFKEVTKLLSETDTFIGVDSYINHHAWYIGKPGIVLFSQSDPLIFGHNIHTNLLKDRSYLRPNQFDVWESTPLNDEAFVTPEEIAEVCLRN